MQEKLTKKRSTTSLLLTYIPNRRRAIRKSRKRAARCTA